ncbi:MAG: hypothetical protein HY791_16575 [Deltaproteobacteria bacterium]|nr:hypothetical protein [Deltaproteobacteria bacterium]
MKKAILSLGLALTLESSVWAAPCKEGKQPEILVKDKTPIRRGPGLNYGVSSFLEKGRCLKLGEVSVDGSWARVEEGDIFGWVPISAVSKESLKTLEIAGRSPSGPVGSGQERGFVKADRAVPLRKEPKGTAEERKVLPAGSELLALSLTKEGAWVEVRDTRGEVGWVPVDAIQDSSNVLQGLPRSEAGLETGMSRIVKTKKKKEGDSKPDSGSPDLQPKDGSAVANPGVDPTQSLDEPEQTLTATVDGPKAEGLDVAATAMAVALLPRHELDSNGVGGTRRYTIDATAAGVHLEAVAQPIGPLRVSLGYTIAVLSGLAPANAPAAKVGGQEHQAKIMMGYPIELGGLKLTPELGYAFGLFSVDLLVPGVENGLLFSTSTHGGALDVRLEASLAESFALHLEGGAQLATMGVKPVAPGNAGLAVGFRGLLGASYEISNGIAAVVDAEFRQISASFTGAAAIDPTITNAKLTDQAIGVFAGVALEL